MKLHGFVVRQTTSILLSFTENEQIVFADNHFELSWWRFFFWTVLYVCGVKDAISRGIRAPSQICVVCARACEVKTYAQTQAFAARLSKNARSTAKFRV